jgi:hypothetical protein
MWNVRLPARSRISISHRLKPGRALAALLTVAFALPAVAHAAVSTVTTLTLSPQSTIAAPAAVTLTASVTGGGAQLTTGSITFCNASAALCEDAAVVGSAQLTAAGTATLKIIPAIGIHTYNAIFSATATAASSTSTRQTLTVTGLYPTSTAIASTGTSSGYGLTATVVGVANHPPVLAGNVSFNDTTDGNYLLGTAPLGAPAFTQGFTPAAGSPVNTGVNSASVGVGDFNGDGIPDLAVAADGEQNITISLGNGDGTFTAGAKYHFETNHCISLTGPSNCAVSVGDFNHDGKADLAVTAAGDNTLTILLGNGDGTFAPAAASPITVGNYPVAVKIGAFNGDGLLDLAVANAMDDTVSILLGNGDGTFTAASGSPVSTGGFPFFLAVADFGNGHADIAVTNENDSTVSILLGNGDGTFTSGQTISNFNYNPGPIVVADFNGDGKVDLAVADFTPANLAINVSYVVVVQGNGDGTFTPFAQSPIAVGFQPFAMVAGDFNQDGNTDLAVANYGDQTLTLLLGDGTGGFAPAGPPTPLGDSPNDLAAADFNGDGTTDLAAPELADNNTTILLYHFYQTATASLANVTIAGTGTHYVDATYPGNTNFAPSTSATIPLQGSTVPTSLTLTANPTQQLVTMPVTFTAQLAAVSVQPVSGTPTGTVSFFVGGVLLGTAAINPAGQAVYTTTGLAEGTDSITASYSGDTGFLPSTSAALSITISDIQVTRSGSTTPIVVPGTTVMYTLKVAPLVASTFLYSVTLSASGLPPGAVATFSPATLSAGGGPTTVTLTVVTANTALNEPPPSPYQRLPLALGLLLPLFGVPGVRRRMRKIPPVLGVLLLAALSLTAVLGLSGCSGAGLFAARKVPYSIAVTATEGTLQRSTSVPLAVQ